MSLLQLETDIPKPPGFLGVGCSPAQGGARHNGWGPTSPPNSPAKPTATRETLRQPPKASHGGFLSGSHHSCPPLPRPDCKYCMRLCLSPVQLPSSSQ